MGGLPTCETLLLERRGGRLYVTLNRPERRNAINAQMSAELRGLIEHLAGDTEIRVVILRGAEGNSCSGGDIKERRQQVEDAVADEDPILERSIRAGHMFLALDRLPQVVIAVVEGAAMGGGLGMACVTDVTLVHKDAKFGLPEVTIGVAPAQIAPYVVKRIGLTEARRLALTGQRFDGAEAGRLGLAHFVCDDSAALEEKLEQVIASVERCGPKANAATKRILLAVGSRPEEDLIRFAAEEFSALNQDDEGREGQRAFVEKRPRNWVPSKDGN